MPFYRVSVKNPCYRAGQCIEPGMSVEINSMFPIVSVNSTNSSKVGLVRSGVIHPLNNGFHRTYAHEYNNLIFF